MVGWMDDEALHRTLTSGRVTFWSAAAARSTGARATPPGTSSTCGRSRWTATATPCSSGSTRWAPACHTGDRTCFDGRDLAARHGRRGERAVTAVAARPGLRHDLAEPGRPSASWPATAASSRSCAGCWPTPRRRSASTASSPRTRPAPSCSSRPSTAACGRATRSSAPRAAATLTERDGEAHWLGEPPVGVPTGGPPLEALRDTVAALATDPARGPAAADRRHGRRDRLRRRAPLGAAARDHAATSWACPEIAMMLAPTSRCSTTPTARCCWWPTR